MNVAKFTAKTSRDALQMARRSLGDDAVVLSTRPGPEGVEVLAMAGDGLQALQRAARTLPPQAGTAQPASPPEAQAAAPATALPRARPGNAQPARIDPHLDLPATAASVEQDVATLSMSTLSFQDYVRERMLRRRQGELAAQRGTSTAQAVQRGTSAAQAPQRPALVEPPAEAPAPLRTLRDLAPLVQPTPVAPMRPRREPPLLEEELRIAPVAMADERAHPAGQAVMDELRAVRGLIEERFGTLAFLEKLQREPRQAALTQRLLEAGFSPALVRKLGPALPRDAGDELAWAAGVLERNLATGELDPALEDTGGIWALIGPTGVGKTTTTAKIAAAFATRHGSGSLGLITLDAYRMAAHEQLRAYGRILGVPVHTAHDRASLEDLLELLAGKRMVLIDTAGMAQRDSRTRELLDMLAHRSIRRLLVLNAAAQGDTQDDVIAAYRGSDCAGVVLSKLDEAVRLAPALDALIRQRLKVLGVANGQRVPEDWHRLSARELVQRALRAAPPAAWRLEAGELNLLLAAQGAAARAPQALRA